MSASYVPAWWLPGPHSMTVWAKFMRRPPNVPTTHETWDTPDGDHITVVRLKSDARAPRIILLHGLEGSARSHYVGGILDQARQRNWGADLLLFRTCDGRVNSVRRSYHSGETSDLDLVVRRVAKEHPDAPLALVGISLGGNVALKWLGEQGADLPSPIKAAVAVSTPFDLSRSSRQIDRVALRLYSRRFLVSLRQKAFAKLEMYPDVASRAAVARARTLREFDDAFTSVVHSFRDAADYYRRSSSLQFLPAIRVPTLLLSARDDPFHESGVLDHVEAIASSNAYLITEFHARGGHVGFVEGRSPHRPRYYAERRIAEFCQEHLSGASTSLAVERRIDPQLDGYGIPPLANRGVSGKPLSGPAPGTR